MQPSEPWMWECPCGNHNSTRHGFCWRCGKPAVAGRLVPAPADSSSVSAPASAPSASAASAGPAGVETIDIPPPTQMGSTFTAPFRVVGADGRLLLSVEETSTGASLQLYNHQGVPSAWVTVGDGGVISVADRSGNRVAVLAGGAAGGVLGLATPESARAVELRATPEGGAMVLYDAHGRPVRTEPPSEAA